MKHVSCLQIAHHKLVENEIMIHNLVDAKVHFIVKSHPEVHGTVEGAGHGLSFLKLQLGSKVSSIPVTLLHHYWSCAFQVY